MKKRHYIEAPGTEGLQNIEQINDRSELSVMYPSAKAEWEGKELLSDTERSRQRDDEHRDITTSAWREFIRLGLLIPTPYVVLLGLIYLGSLTLTKDNLAKLLIPIFLSAMLWIGLSYLSIKKTHDALYRHALPMMPAYLTILVMTAISIEPLLSTVKLAGVTTDLPLYILTTLMVYIACIIISLLVMILWTAPKLSSQARVLLALLMAVILVTYSALI